MSEVKKMSDRAQQLRDLGLTWLESSRSYVKGTVAVAYIDVLCCDENGWNKIILEVTTALNK